MPYNTRRKSLSLPALGIQLPQASRAHRTSISKSDNDSDTSHAPPAKKQKRSNSSSSPSYALSNTSSPPSSVASVTKTVTFADRPTTRGSYPHEHTPPPSPGDSHAPKIDVDGINDDIVVGVIEQLEKTGNRPHLIKELATVLSTTSSSSSSISTYDARISGSTSATLQNLVANKLSRSANPTALLSSRLASYMKRPWTALAPCPIAKELIPVHPRKVFYYLTTTPRQELPTSPVDSAPSLMGPPTHIPSSRRIISPSLSNESQEEGADDSDDKSSMAEDRKRAALSPSPEIDLSNDLDDSAPAVAATVLDFHTPCSTLRSARSSLARSSVDSDRDARMHHRGESPPLEGDEREFTDTARDMRMRSHLEHLAISDESDVAQQEQQQLPVAKLDSASVVVEITVSEEEHVKRNSEAVVALFGPHSHQQRLGEADSAVVVSSPVIGPTMPSQSIATKSRNGAPKTEAGTVVMDDFSILGEQGVASEMGMSWEIGRPEAITVDELDDYFDGF